MGLTAWYNDARRIEDILRPMTGRPRPGHLSLRMLEWFVRSFARRRNISVSSDGSLRNVSSLYRQWLGHYTRNLFDPFRRHARVLVDDLCGGYVSSTCGQLNFLYWAEKFGVLAKALEHRESIELDMPRKPPKKRGRPRGVTAPRRGFSGAGLRR